MFRPKHQRLKGLKRQSYFLELRFCWEKTKNHPKTTQRLTSIISQCWMKKDTADFGTTWGGDPWRSMNMDPPPRQGLRLQRNIWRDEAWLWMGPWTKWSIDSVVSKRHEKVSLNMKDGLYRFSFQLRYDPITSFHTASPKRGDKWFCIFDLSLFWKYILESFWFHLAITGCLPR